MKYKIGIDLGGTNIKFALQESDGTLTITHITPTPTDGYTSILNKIIHSIRIMINDAAISEQDIESAGIAVPGIVKAPKGPVLLAPNINWHNVDPVTELEKAFPFPFAIGNDADCMALAENYLGAGKDFNSFVMLTLGTGVGGAIVHDDKLFTGFTSYGGELGHVPLVHDGHPCNCRQKGCLEQYASATALRRITEEILGVKMAPEDLFQKAKDGDRLCEQVIDTYVNYLCEGITGFINVFRPAGIILGGGIANSGAYLFNKINAVLPTMTYCAELIPVPPVVPAALGMYAGAQGAALL